MRCIKFIFIAIAVLAFCILVAMPVSAENTKPAETIPIIDITEKNTSIYIQNKEDAKRVIEQTAGTLKKNYKGYCGQYVHDMLAKTGIIEKSSHSYNGKDWFYAYKRNSTGNKLCENWTYEIFEGKNAIKKVLEKYNGKVYNLVFSMSSGSQYGHAFFVNAIVDDTVYFTESFGSSYFGAEQKELIILTLDEFVDYYINSNYFIASKGGIIHFYEKDFYKPIISFDEIETKYEYKIINKDKVLSNHLYQDLQKENILYIDKIDYTGIHSIFAQINIFFEKYYKQ